MKMNFTPFFLLLLLPLLSTAQTAGDYRSNVKKDGDWNSADNWETWDGSRWVKAYKFPTSADGIITISEGDSIRINTDLSIDQVRVAKGGILALFRLRDTADIVLTLQDDDHGADLEVHGKLYVSVNARLTGPGSVLVNEGGQMITRFTTILAAHTTIEEGGELVISSLMELQQTLVNHGRISWMSSNFRMNNGRLQNHAQFFIHTTNDVFITSSGGTNTVQNSAAGSIIRTSPLGSVSINATLENEGTIGGLGAYSLNRVNTLGTLAPGNPLGTLTINPPAAFRKSFILPIRIHSGAGAGTGHDQLIATGSPDLSLTTLRVTENTSTPLGTYTIMKAADKFTGYFSSIRLPRGYTLDYTPGSSEVRVIKSMSTEPFVLGSFNGHGKDGRVTLTWNTTREINTSHILIQHSVDGENFVTVGSVPARGNTATSTAYSFVHEDPDPARNNFYRLEQVDMEENVTYSPVISIKFRGLQPVSAFAYPNPVRKTLTLQVQAEQVEVELVDVRGSRAKRMKLQPGKHQVDMTGLPAGLYFVVVYEKMQKKDVQKILKL